MASQAAVLTGALGAVLGYVGGEVAEVVTFERLLWPERFYNDFNFSIALQQGLLMTMGGPLHSAALKTLDSFRNQGLYLGLGRGHFLGTAFYSDKKSKCSITTSSKEPVPIEEREVRNGFWVEVARRINTLSRTGHRVLPRQDAESAEDGNKAQPRFRSIHTVHHIKLALATDKMPKDAPSPAVHRITEHKATWRTFAGIIISETVAIGVGIASIFLGAFWMAIIMALPLLLKLLAVLISLPRETLASMQDLKKDSSLDQTIMVEMFGFEQGFILLEGPGPVVLQFSRHYGHPLRDHGRFIFGDRFREVGCMILVYCFVFYFPIGLILTAWENDSVQYLWLAYELFSVVAMHITRLLDLQGCGRTEHKAARYLYKQHIVQLESPGGAAVVATVRTDVVAGHAEGKRLVRDRISQCFKGLEDSEVTRCVTE